MVSTTESIGVITWDPAQPERQDHDGRAEQRDGRARCLRNGTSHDRPDALTGQDGGADQTERQTLPGNGYRREEGTLAGELIARPRAGREQILRLVRRPEGLC
jgi:hypothetical protein